MTRPIKSPETATSNDQFLSVIVGPKERRISMAAGVFDVDAFNQFKYPKSIAKRRSPDSVLSISQFDFLSTVGESLE